MKKIMPIAFLLCGMRVLKYFDPRGGRPISALLCRHMLVNLLSCSCSRLRARCDSNSGMRPPDIGTVKSKKFKSNRLDLLLPENALQDLLLDFAQ